MKSRYIIVLSPFRLRIFNNHKEYLYLFHVEEMNTKLALISQSDIYYVIKNALIRVR